MKISTPNILKIYNYEHKELDTYRIFSQLQKPFISGYDWFYSDIRGNGFRYIVNYKKIHRELTRKFNLEL